MKNDTISSLLTNQPIALLFNCFKSKNIQIKEWVLGQWPIQHEHLKKLMNIDSFYKNFKVYVGWEKSKEPLLQSYYPEKEVAINTLIFAQIWLWLYCT